MGRYIKDVSLEQPIDVVSMVMDDFIYHNHFSRTDWNGEMVFYLKDRHKKERYMKWVYVDGQFHVEAWLKNSFGGETDLDGIGASKREFRASVDGLIQTLKKTAAGSLSGGHIGSDPLHHDSGHADNHDVWKADTGWQQSGGGSAGQYGQRNAGGSTGQYRPQQAGNTREPGNNQALIFAVLALATGWFFPLAGIILLVMARRGMEYSSNPKSVKIICVLAVIFMIVGFACNIMIGILVETFW